MFGLFPFPSTNAAGLMLGQALPPLPPVLILVLCAVAGIGTVMLLPSRAEPSLRKIGGILLSAMALILLAWLVHGLAGEQRGVSVYFWIFAIIALVGA